MQAVTAAEAGHLGLTAENLAEAATLDLDDLQSDTQMRLHIASLADLWTAVTAGLGGMRDSKTGLRFAPHLPEQPTRLGFGLHVGGRTVRVEITPDATTNPVNEGAPLTIHHFDEELVLHA